MARSPGPGGRNGGTGSPCPNGMGNPVVADVAAPKDQGGTLSTLLDRPRPGSVQACNVATAGDRRRSRSTLGAMRILCVGEALVDFVCERPVASIAEADAFVPH